MLALEALAARPHLVSESYLGPYNGTSAQLENGIPRSHVTGKGGTIITTEQGQQSLTARGIPAEVADLADSLFYNAPETSTFD